MKQSASCRGRRLRALDPGRGVLRHGPWPRRHRHQPADAHEHGDADRLDHEDLHGHHRPAIRRQRKAALDDTLDRWYPQIRHASAITICMLLNMSSGIAGYANPNIATFCANPMKRWRPDELIAMGVEASRLFDRPEAPPASRPPTPCSSDGSSRRSPNGPTNATCRHGSSKPSALITAASIPASPHPTRTGTRRAPRVRRPTTPRCGRGSWGIGRRWHVRHGCRSPRLRAHDRTRRDDLQRRVRQPPHTARRPPTTSFATDSASTSPRSRTARSSSTPARSSATKPSSPTPHLRRGERSRRRC